jgi:hypothetical protein
VKERGKDACAQLTAATGTLDGMIQVQVVRVYRAAALRARYYSAHLLCNHACVADAIVQSALLIVKGRHNKTDQ